MAEGPQPAMKNMALVKNRNNITEMTLAKRLREYDREHSLVLLSIDHDRLDMKDFLRQIRICESDDLPEARHWLGRKKEKERGDLGIIRDVVKLPPLSGRSTTGNRTERTEVTKPEDEKEYDLTASGRFRAKRDLDASGTLTLYKIYSRRAELVDAGPVWGTPRPQEEQTDGHGRTAENGHQEVESVGATSKDAETPTKRPTDDEQATLGAGLPTTTRVGENEMATKDKESSSMTGSVRASPRSAEAGRGERRRRHRNTDGDFMKELLVSNAKKRYRKKKRRPIQERLVEFYTKLEELKQRETPEVPSAKHMRRRYVLLTQGVKAALEMSSDEEGEIG